MKNSLNKWIGLALCAVMAFLSFTSCVEHRYYHEHHYHTRGWYDHRHEAYPPGVQFDIHN